MTTLLPAWAQWCPTAGLRPFSVGIEEEVMLVDGQTWNLASRVDDVIAATAGRPLRDHLSQETHGSAVELQTRPFDDVDGAVAQLRRLREALRETLAPLGLHPAAAGTHPFATWEDVDVSPGPRQQEVHNAMRELARREPTFALHVHIAVPDPEDAMRAMNRMRAHVPLLLALSANSPFWQGRDSGLASARTPLFDAFPRSGLPRRFDDYEALVATTDLLIRAGAIREPSFVWWDVRLQPRYGTVEVRVMDAQTTLEETAALASLVAALVRAECEHGIASSVLVDNHEVLEENRFIALRDGVKARLIDPELGERVAVEDVLGDVLAACGPVPGIEALLRAPGCERQRVIAADGLDAVVQALVAAF